MWRDVEYLIYPRNEYILSELERLQNNLYSKKNREHHYHTIE